MSSHFALDVPDPSDFPPLADAPGLRTLDSSLRCTICGELFDAPVTLPCGHCFCSVCVRAAMGIKQECPTCRKATLEGHLRPNPVLEEVVAAWGLSRPYILKLSTQDTEQRHSSLFEMNAPRAKKRKIAIGSGSTNHSRSGSSILHSPSKRPKSTRQSSEDLYDTTIPTSDADEDEMPSPPKDPGPEDLVTCPLCNKHVRYKSINQHMDRGCKDTPPDSTRSTKSDWQKIMSGNKGKQKDTSDSEDNFPLPKASYATLKDKKLKEMLAEHGLPVSGDRNLLIQRHQRWVMTYNANLDRSQNNRKSKQELKKELKKWEDERSKRKKTTVEDTVAHEKRHKDEFAQLVDAARGNRNSSTKQSLVAEQSNGDTVAPASSDSRKTPIRGRVSRDEDIIVLDSEEERERGD
ncbi:Postreplication repair E3 ubiquitin-protein ligase rad18 [Hypsizygus marmoreus]|uniref:Postreplication repair E3 ubiquitin-protein ligase RAD18 n=1 Tax=Hypsizygus marmoreus TaxID=39966 RepID=A0A369JX04_HYPMA|nr:Postreplication repair E3 ubiquitin-protein ligase rad18 [Hypsizygus marmoreus]